MQPQELRTLKILEAVEQEDAPSQRELARRLNVSLGLVNSFIKRLVNKGYFKISSIPANRARYILTPKGATEKTRLTYEYIRHSFGFYREMRLRMEKRYGELETQGVRDLAFCGVSELAEIAYLVLLDHSMTLVGVFDPKPGTERLLGHDVMPLEDIAERPFDRVFVTALVDPVGMTEKILARGVAPEKIVTLEKDTSSSSAEWRQAARRIRQGGVRD
jgi:DNA-binding MarR family transcriptional regulator